MLPFFRRSSDKKSDITDTLLLIAETSGTSMQSDASLPRLPPAAQSVDSIEKRSSILRNLFQSDDMITVPNNTTVDIPRSERTVRLYAQSLAGEDSLTESTNSSYSRISEIISFSWEYQRHVNLLAVHRTQPLVAYVINTTYHKAFVTGKNAVAKPEDQMLRLVNYENQSRALCKPVCEAPIADMAFSFDSPKRPQSNLIVTIDRSGIMNLLSFTGFSFSNSAPQLSLVRLLTIRPSPDIAYPAERMRLSWCMFIPGDGEEEEPPVDPSLRLTVTTGTNVEVFTFNDYHMKSQDSTVERSYFKPEVGEYYVAHNVHQKEIVSAAISNDGSLACSASLANILVFNQIEDEKSRMQYLREWRPPHLPAGEVVVFSAFLDDVDYLLSNPDQMFWGYLLVATNGGHMFIYDLQEKDWTLVQHVNIICEEGSGSMSDFSYHADKSSKVILAVKHRVVFVFQMEFADKAVRVPRFKQVARLQLYNEVISMQVKQTSEEEIEIFWVTLKNLERCTIDIKKMNESKMVSKPERVDVVDHASPLAKVFKKERNVSATSPKEQELLNKLQEKSNELNSMKQRHEPVSTVALTPASSSSPAAKPMDVTPATPNSESQINSLLGKLMSNGQQQKKLQQHVSNSPLTPSFSAPQTNTPNTPAAPALNDMAKIMLIEDKLKTFENRFTKQFEVLTATIMTGFQGMHKEVGQLKAEVQQPSASKQATDRNVVEMTINKVVEKSMKQLNQVVSKGLKDFFDQTDVGIGELQAKVTQSNKELKSAYGETCEQVSAVKSQMDLFVKQMERLDAQQQLLLFRYQQLIDQQ